MEQDPAIQIDNLTVRFSGKAIVERFSLRMDPGDRVTLTGRSGSGKSTILRCILGFTVPDEGSIAIEGEPVSGASIWKLRARLAYVAQEPDLGTGQVRHILERPFAYHANAHLWGDQLKVQELFQRFMLPAEMMDKDIVALSGGERQRVAIVSAILLRRPIFLLDESSSALDKTARQAVAEFFKSQDSLTILSVAHDPEGFSFSNDIIELPGGSDGGGQ